MKLISNQINLNDFVSDNYNTRLLDKLKLNNKNTVSDDTSSENNFDDKLMEACKSFESYFVDQVIKEMRKTVPKDEEDKDTYSYFEDLLYREYAESITEQGELGLSQILYESMKRDYDIST